MAEALRSLLRRRGAGAGPAMLGQAIGFAMRFGAAMMMAGGGEGGGGGGRIDSRACESLPAIVPDSATHCRPPSTLPPTVAPEAFSDALRPPLEPSICQTIKWAPWDWHQVGTEQQARFARFPDEIPQRRHLNAPDPSPVLVNTVN